MPSLDRRTSPRLDGFGPLSSTLHTTSRRPPPAVFFCFSTPGRVGTGYFLRRKVASDSRCLVSNVRSCDRALANSNKAIEIDPICEGRFAALHESASGHIV